MFYRMYLSSVCQRRHWPDPHYESYQNRDGFYCKVRVNNREYSTDVPYATEELARDGAAVKAYMICRNFSSNDGYYPGQRPGQTSTNGVVQGVPVPIGTGRRGNRRSYDSNNSDTSGSEGNSPKSNTSGFDQQLRQVTRPMPQPYGRRMSHQIPEEYDCLCRRAPIQAYGRCSYCLHGSGWTRYESA